MEYSSLSILSEAERAFIKRLHELDSRWSFFRDDLNEGRLTAELPCEHPKVKCPLRIIVGGEFAMTWYAGVFFEARSLSLTAWSDALDLVSGFLNETVWHALAYNGERVVALGSGREQDWKKWHPCFDTLEIKTWRGAADQTVLITPDGLGVRILPQAEPLVQESGEPNRNEVSGPLA